MGKFQLTSRIAANRVALLIGILFNAAMIIVAARGDLWFDEIWSLSFAESARTPWDIVSVFKHDNNHVLNTFFLFVIGRHDNLILYRTLAILSGIGSLVMLVKIARKQGFEESIFALLFAGTSYPLILYFSEARGYAPAIFFALASYYLLQEGLSRFSWRRMVLFWITALLGTLSHFTYVIVLLSLMIYTFAEAVTKGSTVRTAIAHLLRYFAIPLMFIGAFYLYFIRNIVIGGGDDSKISTEISRGIAYLLGMPEGLASTPLPAMVFFVLILFASYLYFREKDVQWLFYISIMVLVPALILFMARPAYFHFRYLIICFPFFYLMLASVSGRLYRNVDHKYRYMVMVVACLFIIGQISHLVPLFKFGRGNYRSIVAEMSRSSSGKVITIGSDHDFRNGMLLSFYSRFLLPDQSLHYRERSSWDREPPEWIITHSTSPSYRPELYVLLPNDQVYELTKEEKFACNSGFSWFLYHHRTGTR